MCRSETTPDIKKFKLEHNGSSVSETFKTIFPSTFQDYVSNLNFTNVRYLQNPNYDKYLFPGMFTGSVVYNFEKDDKIFEGLYVLSHYYVIIN